VTPLLLEAFIYLLAAVVAVPLAGRLGLGSVLGYLVAGVVIGPVLGLVGSEESVTIQHYAEFGVVMMLFLVGLELEPAMLWRMRNRDCWASADCRCGERRAVHASAGLGLDWQLRPRRRPAAVPVLDGDRPADLPGEGAGRKTEGARSAFSVLLFQDIAVIPMLALIPLLAMPELAGMAPRTTTTVTTN
jgi:Kef-type K+ transport system membrane component KefB